MNYNTFFYKTNNGNICLKDERPEELYDLVYDIHQEFNAMPNNWFYGIIAEAFYFFEEDGLDIDDINIETDCYRSDLYKWFGEPFATACIEDYQEEFGIHSHDVWTIISNGQWLAMDKIYRLVSDFILSKEADE